MNRKTVILLAALSFVSSVYAEEERNDEENRFDGSEFNASSFKDTNFDKPDYKELRRTVGSSKSLIKESSNASAKEGGGLKKRRDEISNIPSQSDKKNSSAKSSLTAEEKIPLVYDLPSDWVPSGVQLTNNGGFSTAPDNGLLVPYRLNGDIDIQRGRP